MRRRIVGGTALAVLCAASVIGVEAGSGEASPQGASTLAGLRILHPTGTSVAGELSPSVAARLIGASLSPAQAPQLQARFRLHGAGAASSAVLVTFDASPAGRPDRWRCSMLYLAEGPALVSGRLNGRPVTTCEPRDVAAPPLDLSVLSREAHGAQIVWGSVTAQATALRLTATSGKTALLPLAAEPTLRDTAGRRALLLEAPKRNIASVDAMSGDSVLESRALVPGP
jgi:hypothetical protein